MRFTLIMITEAALLASSLSLDAFTAGFAYGGKRIRIPAVSVAVINLICSAATGLSLFAGAMAAPFFKEGLAVGAAFAILLIIGVMKLLDGITKSIIRKHTDLNKRFELSLFNLKFILNLYADPEAADIDESKDISPAEAAALAFSLSLDGIAVGFGAALANVNGLAVFLWSLVTNVAAIMLGCRLGNKIAGKAPFCVSWLSGLVLIGLAVSKLI